MEAEISCPYCGESIKSQAKKCRHCGEWIEKPTENIISEPSPVIKVTEKKSDSSDWMYYELIGIGGVTWGLTDSWMLGIGVAIGGLILMHIPFLGYIFCYLLGIIWGIIAGGLCGYFLGNYVIGGITGVVLAFAIAAAHVKARKNSMEEDT